MLQNDELSKTKQDFSTQMRSLDRMNLELTERNQDLEAIINERDLQFNDL